MPKVTESRLRGYGTGVGPFYPVGRSSEQGQGDSEPSESGDNPWFMKANRSRHRVAVRTCFKPHNQMASRDSPAEQ